MIRVMTPHILRRLALSLLVVVPVLVSAQQTPTAPAAAPDMIDRIFTTHEFSPRPSLAPEWFDGGASYLLVEPVAGGSGQVTWCATTARPAPGATC